ncbi:NAD-dependent epimerase/dehydratase family protein [Streptomyces polygonati]|uniref:NAD-dependent epimerase/dehydratase family protein n=1 Tax=Streptomyces polygonati TaxID=1617087 RepID=A0ABV8HXM0_9ACTN
MAKVFVTGIAGFLGSHVAERFRDIGWEVCGIDNLRGGRAANVPEDVRFEVVDCLDRSGYLPLLAGSDLVYHCASAAYDGLSVFSPAFVYRNTAQATVEVASASVASGVRRFIHCSSMARYGALPAPFTEDMPPAPVNPYGLAKHASELIVRNLFETHGGEYTIAVPHNIIGPRQRYDDPYRNVASIMINRMLRGLQPVIYGDGSNLRCFSFVQDVLFCLERMGTSPEAAGETINIGPDEGAVSILRLAEEIAGLLDFGLDPVFVPSRPLEVEVATCSADKARRLLGYKTSTSLRDGLETMIQWIAEQGPSEFSYDIDIEINSALTPSTWVGKLI